MRDAALAFFGLIEVVSKVLLLILISLPLLGLPILLLSQDEQLHHFTQSALWDKIR